MFTRWRVDITNGGNLFKKGYPPFLIIGTCDFFEMITVDHIAINTEIAEVMPRSLKFFIGSDRFVIDKRLDFYLIKFRQILRRRNSPDGSGGVSSAAVSACVR